MVAELLLARGFERIAFIAGLERSSTSVERERGFNEALAEAGRKVYRRAVGDYSFDGAQAATRALFGAEGPAPDALFVANDHMAIAAMDVLRNELALRVPEDVSVVGFDDVEGSAYLVPSLTTVRQPFEAVGRAAVRALLEAWRTPDEKALAPVAAVMPPELMVRGSTGEHR